MHSLAHSTRDIADQLPSDTDWHRYVPGPSAADVHPISVLSSTGDVSGTETFLAKTGSLTLSVSEHGSPASIVLDFGRNVAGRPWFDIATVDGPTTLDVSYSEAAAWAGADGDERGGHNASADRRRSRSLTIERPGRIDTDLIQGGQRYVRLSLDTPGTLSLAGIGFRFSAFAAAARDYAGWFVCSDDELNRIWYESAYTTQLNQLPADTLPIAWTIDEDSLHITGGTLAVLRDGEWDDVTVEFEARILDHAAGWIVRAAEHGAHGYLLELRAPTDDASSLLRLSHIDDGYEDRPQDTVRRYTTLAEVALASDFDASSWHRIRTAVQGTTIAVSIDGAPIAHFDLAEHPATPRIERGSFGFHEAWDTSKVPGEQARFRELRLTNPAGDELFQHRLDDAAALELFTGDGVVSPDPLPVILDGARRDRSVWSGDLIVQIPNVFYTTAAAEYVSGSIAFLNSFQEPDGRLPARMPPLFPPAVPPQHGQVYSAVYSMHQITNVALHLEHTGDLDFARSQWPAVLRQLAYDRALVDDRDLYITDDENGLDWDWYDGPKTGAVTAYNIVYNHVLRQAAVLAAALGEDETAAELTGRADRNKAAINAHLFDPGRSLYVLSDQRQDAIAQDANSLAVLHGIAAPGTSAAILLALDEALPQTPYGPQPFDAAAGFRENVSPYTSGFHLGALFSAGLTDRALELLHDLWGHMAASGPYAAGTVWELLNIDGTPGFGSTTSLAHGWACAPTVALSASVLGVTPTSTAFRTWRIAPQTGSLTWARGQVPTPFGAIEASWHRDESGLTVDVVAPAGTGGTITVPSPSGALAHLRGLTVDGDTVEHTGTATRGTSSVTFEVTAGRYTVEI
ncbi:hypothetical protein HRK28_19330 [Rathayibacter sp. VKM Ac-2835]|uniref:alpha-L-rhamnosidase-related protein n=1 Tax=Rathayibacter sp. VKM Ac-2835 TaxID=2739043 RepID=UPI001564C72F|nr:hypothetical protein [Rathayibacter sp. VKM Ac-2835]